MKKLIRSEYLPLIILLVVNLVVGLIVLPDYGESWDEAMLFQYADRSMRAYGSLLTPSRMPVSFLQGDPLHGDHGPAFVMLVSLIRQAVQHLNGSIPATLINHLAYFVVFQIGIIALYFLSRRWLSAAASFGTSLLFSTQPVLWGHVFINPKDSVFMLLFLASLSVGLWMVDRVPETTPVKLPDLGQEFALLTKQKKYKLFLIGVLWLLGLFSVLIWGSALVEQLISSAYSADSTSILGRLFAQVATPKTGVPAAIWKRARSPKTHGVMSLFISAPVLMVTLT